MAKVEKRLFTWRGKDYTVLVNEDVWDNRQYIDAKGNVVNLTPEDLYRLAVKALPIQKNEDGSQKYPEMTPRPKVDIDADREWINERLKTSQPANYLEAYKYTSAASPTFNLVPPSQQAVKEWEENFPLAKEFYDEMSRYGLGQGATYGGGEDVGLQGDIRPYKAFSQMYPGQSMLTEFAGAIPTGGGLVGGTRALIRSVGPEALARTAPIGQRFWRFLATMGGSAAENIAHMLAWRYGHEMVDPEDPFTTERFTKAVTGPHAGQDYTLAAGLGAALPLAGRAYTGLKQMLANMKERSSGMEMLRLVESFEASLPGYAAEGIDEAAIMRAINHRVDQEGMSIMDAVVQTKSNLDDVLTSGATPVLHAGPGSRDVGWAATKVPETAGLVRGERMGELSQVPQRMEDLLMTLKGGLRDPFGEMRTITGGMRTRMQALYDRMERGKLDRDVFRNLIKPEGAWEARVGKKRTTIDKAWDDTVAQVNKTIDDPAAKAEHIEKFGSAPTRLATREEFLDNMYVVKATDSKRLIDSGEFTRAMDTAGNALPRRSKEVDGVIRYFHVLRKTNNTIDPKHAQMISQNIGEYAKWKNPKDQSVGAATVREAADVRGARKAWDEVIGKSLPDYAAANKLNNEIHLIERSFDEAGKMTLKTTGDGYRQFNKFIEDARKTGSLFDEGSEAFNNAKNIFYGMAIKQIIGEGTTPQMILSSPEIQQRLLRFIGDKKSYDSYIKLLMDEEAKRGVTQYLPAPEHQVAAPGTTALEKKLSAPSFIEQLPHDVAMGFFSLPFWAGRRAGTAMGKIRGLENEATALELLKRLSSTDRTVKLDTVEKLNAELAKLRSQIDTGAGATRINPATVPLTFEGGMEYGMPSKRRRREGLVR